MSVSQSEVLAYARACLRDSPNLPPDVLREVLKARFVDGRDPLAAAEAQHIALGAIANPMDWLQALAMIFRGLSRVFGSNDVAGILDIIEGVVKIVSESSSEGSAGVAG